MRRIVLLVTAVLTPLFFGCGGSGGTPQFTIASGNWTIPLAAFSGNSFPIFAGGQLMQDGSNISGMLRITGSPCFDPVADQLEVSGNVASGADVANALTLTTAPVRGQVLTFTGTWDRAHPPTILPPTSPPNPVKGIDGQWTITGGSCAGTAFTGAQLTDFSGPLSNGGMIGQGWKGNFTGQLSQSGPDAQGFFHVTGTFNVAGSPCFTSGTITSSSVEGEITQLTVTMDSGQLVGSGTLALEPDVLEFVLFNFTVQGGVCNGQTVTATAAGLVT